jgi:hypothetical protein
MRRIAYWCGGAAFTLSVALPVPPASSRSSWLGDEEPPNKRMQLTKRTEAGGARLRARKFIL